MKKIGIFLTIILMMLTMGNLTGCTSRDQILKIYNWGEYIDQGTLDSFPEWYKEQTGNNIKVEYDTFLTNEDMYTEVAIKKKDYDLVCPSDYMVAQMLSNNLLLPYDKSIVDTSGIKPILMSDAKAYDPTGDYALPYLWGTLGIMYDTTKVNSDDMNSWSALFDGKYNGVYMKDSVRDDYAIANIYANTAKLSDLSSGFTDYNDSYQACLDDMFGDASNSTISLVENTLLAQKPLVKKYENDEGKEEMIDGGNNAGALGLFWSCDAGYAMSENTDLQYTVPKEGSNLWVDNFAIPKYAKNLTAANWFMQYLNQDGIAYNNMDYVGSSSAVQSAMDSFKQDMIDNNSDMVDFTGLSDDFQADFIDTMFPSDEELARCKVMKYFGEQNLAVNKMFINVKSK